MSKVVNISDLIDAFILKGFQYEGKSDDGWHRLNGCLCPPSDTDTYSCNIEIDPNFIDLPRIQLTTIPQQLPQINPHIGDDGNLCYLAKGAVVLDIFDPIGQALACLARAENVLGQILNQEVVDDLIEEFNAYWSGTFCFLDLENDWLGFQNCIYAENKTSEFLIVTDNPERSYKKLSSLDIKKNESYVLTYKLKTNALPRPLSKNWPPKNVSEVLAWQSLLDSRSRKKILQRINEAIKLSANCVLIIIESPTITYGFGVFFKKDKGKTKGHYSSLKGRIFDMNIQPITIMRIDDKYLSQRNIPKLRTLSGKRIAMIGCGTIGGYLAEMLVKAGAGTSDGKLILIDCDIILPENIGRHRLGFPHLLTNKATALTEELKRLSPGSDIQALPIDAKQASLENIDLLIDATGEEALGHWLSNKYSNLTTMLSVWVEGPGTAVRALLKSNNAGACYRCLWHSNKKGKLRSVTTQLPMDMAGNGCEGLYVPFPAHVSVNAASLATEMTLDWVNGISTPSLRTRLTDTSFELATPDCNPLVDSDCPICN